MLCRLRAMALRTTSTAFEPFSVSQITCKSFHRRFLIHETRRSGSKIIVLNSPGQNLSSRIEQAVGNKMFGIATSIFEESFADELRATTPHSTSSADLHPPSDSMLTIGNMSTFPVSSSPVHSSGSGGLDVTNVIVGDSRTAALLALSYSMLGKRSQGEAILTAHIDYQTKAIVSSSLLAPTILGEPIALGVRVADSFESENDNESYVNYGLLHDDEGREEIAAQRVCITVLFAMAGMTLSMNSLHMPLYDTLPFCFRISPSNAFNPSSCVFFPDRYQELP